MFEILISFKHPFENTKKSIKVSTVVIVKDRGGFAEGLNSMHKDFITVCLVEVL
jgi:hypothetical protein